MAAAEQRKMTSTTTITITAIVITTTITTKAKSQTGICGGERRGSECLNTTRLCPGNG